MARKEQCILTNMVMVYDEDKILVQDRVNPNWPGVTFPGGHIEKEESFTMSAIREVKEETGLDISNLELCGFKQWSKKNEYRYIVIYFKTNCFKGELKSSDEGKVFWIKRDELKNYKLAEDFEEMIKVFESDDLNENYFYENKGEWHIENL